MTKIMWEPRTQAPDDPPLYPECRNGDMVYKNVPVKGATRHYPRWVWQCEDCGFVHDP